MDFVWGWGEREGKSGKARVSSMLMYVRPHPGFRPNFRLHVREPGNKPTCIMYPYFCNGMFISVYGAG